MSYIDGYVVPVKTARKQDYERIARTVGRLFLKHGALRCVETWGDDVPFGTLTSFPRAIKLEEDETAVFAWIEFPDKATRDAVHKAVFEDPRLEATMDKSIVPGERMIFGGFETLVDLS